MTQDVDQVVYSALSALPCPVSQPPGDSSAETYVTFNEAGATAHTASNDIKRVKHLIQVHVYSHKSDDTARQTLSRAMELLRASGVRVYSWGPYMYEPDTDMRHAACTATWWEKQATEPAESE